MDGLEAGLAAQDVQQELLFELAALGLYQLLHILLVLGSAGHAGGQIVELVLVLFPPAKHIVGLVEQFPDGTIEEGAVPPADQQHDDRGQQDEHRDPEGRDAGPEVLLFVVGGITGDAVEVDGLALHKVVADGAGDAQMPVREVAGIGQRVGQLGVGGGDGLAVRVEQHHVIAQRLPLPASSDRYSISRWISSIPTRPFLAEVIRATRHCPDTFSHRLEVWRGAAPVRLTQ